MNDLAKHDVSSGPSVDRLMNEREAAARLGVTVAAVRKWRLFRRGPTYFKISRCIRYSEQHLQQFLAAAQVELGGKGL